MPDATSNLRILGSGTYKVGGEFAVQQQMSLELSVGGGAPQHFDSGLVTGGGEFPRININVSLHQNKACIDTVIHVDATDPIVASAGTGSDPSKELWAVVAPNPFHGQTQIRLVLPRSGDLDVTIYDVGGRAVRHLTKAAGVPAGLHAMSWDGRRDQGPACASGVYFLGAHVGTVRTMKRIVKLE
ncbi:MAG: T9SS type A sorting domain-containing protein [Candidatus Eisenbacteria bacterium]|uniref:T9SS type A sorting domain-containing protein n=1 Tax=Eiseniibacteriota bacterium TaxID=2212470 RepID=A0A538T2M3_UNCEI|nr:MAG: T9SS type A sorting domain-containing protein [Candidatus Eisenbacteria bacterium]